MRAVYQEMTNSAVQSGGSTLTQQLIKNQILTNEVSFDRKAKEILLALRLEKLLENYEKGSAMLKECRARLDRFRKKIEVLRKDDGENGVWQDFTPENSRAVNALNEAEVKVQTSPAPQAPDDGLPF